LSRTKQKRKPPLPVRFVLFLARTGFILVLTLLLAEGGARLFLDLEPSRFRLFVPADTGLYRLRPGFDDDLAIQLNPGEPPTKVPARVSSQGLRDREYGPKREGEVRILMLGDSQTFGWGVTVEDSLPRQLERLLAARFPGKDMTVVNGGVPGYGPWNAQALLEEVEPALRPDVVILQTFLGNDLSDTLEQLEPGLHTLAPYHLVRTQLVWRMRHHDKWPMAIDNGLLNHSRIYYTLWQGGAIDLPCCELAAYVPFFPQVPPLELPESEDRYVEYEADLLKTYPMLRTAWRMFLDDIADMRDYCDLRGITFGVYNIPYPFDLARIEELGPQRDVVWGIDSAAKRLEVAFALGGYRHARMLDVFRDAEDPASLAFAGNEHLTPRGARRVAEEVCRQFLDEELRDCFRRRPRLRAGD